MKSGENISEELIAWRRDNELSREDAAELLGVATVSLLHWEQGRPCGMVGMVRKLIAALSKIDELEVERD